MSKRPENTSYVNKRERYQGIRCRFQIFHFDFGTKDQSKQLMEK